MVEFDNYYSGKAKPDGSKYRSGGEKLFHGEKLERRLVLAGQEPLSGAKLLSEEKQ
jgi:hypothetical protein